MFDNEIISPNLKVKKIRKILRLTQEELCEGICTKNNLSQIENNKQKLTFNIATKIAANFNIAAKDKNIDIETIVAENLMIGEDDQAENMIENMILKELRNTDSIEKFENNISEAEILINKYNINNNIKIRLYKLASDFYYYNNMYYKSEEMSDNGLKASIDSRNSLEEACMYSNKARINVNQNKCLKALEQLERAEKINNIIKNKELFEKIYFNKALAYKKIKEYNKAIKYLKMLNEKFEIKNVNKQLDLKMLYANCLNDMGDFNQAEKEYISILEPLMKSNNKNFIALVYRNLSELYLDQSQYKNSAIKIEESLNHNPGNVHLGKDLYFAAKVFKNINIDESETYLLKALGVCEKKDKENFSLIEKIIYELVVIYGDKEDEINMNLMLKKMNELKIDQRLVYQELSEYYRDINREKSKKYNRISINMAKVIKDF